MARLDGISNERFRIYFKNDIWFITHYSIFGVFGSISYHINKVCKQSKGEIKC